MNSDDVQHLATLARLKLTDTELVKFTKDLQAILPLIEKIKGVSSDNDMGRIENASVRNVVRRDDYVMPSGTYTPSLVAGMPETENGYNKVKKIL